PRWPGRASATRRWSPTRAPAVPCASPRSTTSARAARPTACRTSTSFLAGTSGPVSRRRRCTPEPRRERSMTGDIEWLEGGVTAVPGILAGGVEAGIKPSGKKDLALIHSPSPARSAAVFTTNQVKGAPPQGGREAAEAILTTDTRTKEAALRCEIGGRTVTFGGIAKGVGMIEPHLATMFCFVTTDAAVARGALDPILKRSVERSFNRITV